jgi:hypothetical protein
MQFEYQVDPTPLDFGDTVSDTLENPDVKSDRIFDSQANVYSFEARAGRKYTITATFDSGNEAALPPSELSKTERAAALHYEDGIPRWWQPPRELDGTAANFYYEYQDTQEAEVHQTKTTTFTPAYSGTYRLYILNPEGYLDSDSPYSRPYELSLHRGTRREQHPYTVETRPLAANQMRAMFELKITPKNAASVPTSALDEDTGQDWEEDKLESTTGAGVFVDKPSDLPGKVGGLRIGVRGAGTQIARITRVPEKSGKMKKASDATTEIILAALQEESVQKTGKELLGGLGGALGPVGNVISVASALLTLDDAVGVAAEVLSEQPEEKFNLAAFTGKGGFREPGGTQAGREGVADTFFDEPARFLIEVESTNGPLEEAVDPAPGNNVARWRDIITVFYEANYKSAYLSENSIENYIPNIRSMNENEPGIYDENAFGDPLCGANENAPTESQSSRAFTIEQGSISAQIAAFDRTESIESAFDYSGFTSGLRLQKADTARLFLYKGPNGLSLGTIIDSVDSSDGGSAKYEIEGLPAGGQWVVRDDSGDIYGDSPSWSWADGGNTDGGAFRGGLNDDFEIEVTVQLNEGRDEAENTESGTVDDLEFVYGEFTDPTVLDLETGDSAPPVTIRRSE